MYQGHKLGASRLKFPKVRQTVVLFLLLSLHSLAVSCNPLLAWRPHNTNLNQQQQTNSYSDTSNFSNDPGGCSIIYYDELLQPIGQLNGTTAFNNQSTSNAMQALASASLQLPPSQQNANLLTSSTGQATSIGLDCQHITSEQLHYKFNRIKASGMKVTSLVVKDSNLSNLSNMPQGIHELRKLIISNTSIDLEVLKEGSESLNLLEKLEITNEKISNIPQNFFEQMSSLKDLKLENDEIASLDGDAFHNLDDSLETLDLKRNRFNRFPMAVKNLAQLAILDLSDNEIVIDTQENDLPEKLEPLLNLRELVMNRINCTCEFSSSPFFEWIARTHISGVRCFAPDKLKNKEVIVFERDEFCARSAAAAKLEDYHHLSAIILILCQLIASIYMFRGVHTMLNVS